MFLNRQKLDFFTTSCREAVYVICLICWWLVMLVMLIVFKLVRFWSPRFPFLRINFQQSARKSVIYREYWVGTFLVYSYMYFIFILFIFSCCVGGASLITNVFYMQKLLYVFFIITIFGGMRVGHVELTCTAATQPLFRFCFFWGRVILPKDVWARKVEKFKIGPASLCWSEWNVSTVIQHSQIANHPTRLPHQ